MSIRKERYSPALQVFLHKSGKKYRLTIDKLKRDRYNNDIDKLGMTRWQKEYKGHLKAIPDGEDILMEKYVRPEMDVELFRAEIITTSLSPCPDDELIPIPGSKPGGGDFD